VTTDENGQRIPWLTYGSFITVLVVQLVGAIVWATRLDQRISVVEVRGSPEAIMELEKLRERG
jgi:hypothetical protein